jgi:ATP-binding cassette subfamily B protein
MKKYLPVFSKYKKALILAPVLVIIDVICEIVQPELMSKIVDFGVSQKNMGYILHTEGIMVMLSLVAIAANVGNIYYSSHVSVGLAAELQKGIL